MAAEPERTRQIVVIGASAGGIEALRVLVAALPQEFPAPIVIAQHLDPRRGSHLEEILTRASRLPVKTIEGRVGLESGIIYVVPPNHYVEISESEVQVNPDSQRSPLPSIDLLFTTAAEAFGENAIALILSGTGQDGSAGARDIKAAGGTVVIQNPETAGFPAMPLSLPPSIVDIVVNLESIGALLVDLLAGTYPVQQPTEDKQLRQLLDQLRDRSGIDFTSYKVPTIMRRLQRRMVATGTTRLSDYVRYLQRNPDEYTRLTNSFLIKVTEFFRDPELFEYLREQVLPQLLAEAHERGELRIWSAGCATGEEAYSLAILVAELLGEALTELNVRIFATDLDADAVAFARRGVYPSATLSAVPPEMIARYFTSTDSTYEVRKSVRALVVFGQHDLGQRAPFPRIDLTLCRNVLIYFTTELQKRALQLFAFSLRDGGYLALGKAETVSPLPEYFAVEQPRFKVYRRVGERVMIPTVRIRDTTPAMPFRLPQMRQLVSEATAPRQRREPSHLIFERAESILLRLPVGVVVVDRQYDIRLINSTARRLLGIHTEAIGADLIHLVQYVPLRELRNAIDAAFRGEATTLPFEIKAEQTATGQNIDIEIRCYAEPPLSDGSELELVTLAIWDVTDHASRNREVDGQLEQLQEEYDRAVAQLQRVTEANATLVAANNQLTTLNAELRNANEELLVANEEVQSATEEVETLNEELQSTNEELETLNEELQATVEELNTTNDDLQARSIELQDLAISLEVQRRESEAERDRMLAITNAMSAGLVVVNASGDLIMLNERFRELFGEAGEAFVPLADDGAVIDGDQSLQHRAARGEAFVERFVINANGATRRFEASARPVGNGTERRGVIVVHALND